MTACDAAGLRVAVATHDPIPASQVRVIDAMAAVPEVEFVEWAGPGRLRRIRGSLVVAEVVALTPRTFRERAVRTFAPSVGSPYPDGLGTLSAAGSRALIDGKRMHFVPETVRLEVVRMANRFKGGRR
jgi:hypothetical protein